MQQLILKKIIPPLRGTLIQGKDNISITVVGIKPENLKHNTLFFNLIRQRDFKKYKSYQSAIVSDIPIDTSSVEPDTAIIKVANIHEAYWDFVRYYRRLFRIPVIGITGTCGKTTTTEMIKHILSQKYKIHATINGNNAWYLSLPHLLGINEKTQAAVFEMGVGAPGHLRYMCKHYAPQVGVLLNIGTYHLLGCKTQENYIKAKGELIAGIDQRGKLILNADDENIKKIDLTTFKGKIIYFGLTNKAQFQAVKVNYVKEGMEFNLLFRRKSYDAYVPGYGEHNVYNALAAIAACYSVGIPPGESTATLASFKPVRHHMVLRPGINGCTIIDDTWNCTPPSMESALKVLKDLGQSKSTVAVLGYMPQLGIAGQKEYNKIGKLATLQEIDFLITLGKEAKKIGIAAIEAGFNAGKLFHCESAEELYRILLPLTGRDSLILFKFPYKYRLSKEKSFRLFMDKIFL